MRISCIISAMVVSSGMAQVDSNYLDIVPDIMLGFPERTGHIIHSDSIERRNPLDQKNTHDRSVQFGRIYPNTKLQKDDQDEFGFKVVPGDNYVFLLYENDEPENSLSNTTKTAFELSELPEEKRIIYRSELAQINYVCRDNFSSNFIDIPQNENKSSLKIFPFNKNEFRILFFDEKDSYNKPIPLYDTGAVSFYLNHYNDTLVYSSSVRRHKRSLMASKSYLEDRGLLGDPTGEMTVKIQYPNEVNTYYHYREGQLDLFKNFSEDFIMYFDPQDESLVYESAFIHYRIEGPDGKLLVTSVGERDDVPRAIGSYKNYLPVGKWVYSYPGKQTMAEGKYKQGENGQYGPHGKWRYYYSNGQLMATGKYRFDKDMGQTLMLDNWRFYNDEGVEVETLPGVRTIKGDSIFLPLPDYLAVMRAVLKIYNETW